MQSTKLQPLQLINQQGSPDIVHRGEGPQIHVQPSPWATTPMGSDYNGTFCHFFLVKRNLILETGSLNPMLLSCVMLVVLISV